MDPIYVFGHRNPDTDAICSAIAYAYFKNTQASGYIPARLGPINRETRFVLDTFDIAEPIFLPHVHVRVQDIMSRDVITAPLSATIYEVGELMRQHEVQGIPLVDNAGRARGIVTERSLARNYLRELQVQSLQDNRTALSKIAKTLNGILLVGRGDTEVSGNVVIGALNTESIMSYTRAGDLVVLGNRENAQEAALECNPSCLIITSNFSPSEAIQQMARKKGAGIIVTPYDTFASARLINLSLSASHILDTTTSYCVAPESLVSEITQDLLSAKSGLTLVTNDEEQLLGVVSKSDILRKHKRKVILVDHSERAQSADGVERAEILEIIDHHRLGGMETSDPILALIAPVGCTATLVLRRFRGANVNIPRSIAGIMIAAILSDTMLLKSPTTTPEDIEAIEYLGNILGEEPMAFGQRMYNAKFDIANLPAASIATNDLKFFDFGNTRVAISQLEVGDKESVLERKTDLLTAMRQYQKAENVDLMVLMITDLFREGTELLAVGNTRAIERAFDAPLIDHSLYLPGVLSRKKQIVPPLANAL